jgi:hypothetical protein
MKAVSFPHYGVVCDYSVDEMRRVYHRKFPDKLWQMDAFLSTMLLSVKIISTPPEEESVEDEAAIRDIKDRPILRAAVKSDADVLILTYPHPPAEKSQASITIIMKNVSTRIHCEFFSLSL